MSNVGALAAYKLRRRASQQYQGISERSISLWNGFHSLCNSLLRSKQARMLVVRDQEVSAHVLAALKSFLTTTRTYCTAGI
jgi:hypothetical protein